MDRWSGKHPVLFCSDTLCVRGACLLAGLPFLILRACTTSIHHQQCRRLIYLNMAGMIALASLVVMGAVHAPAEGRANKPTETQSSRREYPETVTILSAVATHGTDTWDRLAEMCQ